MYTIDIVLYSSLLYFCINTSLAYLERSFRNVFLCWIFKGILNAMVIPHIPQKKHWSEPPHCSIYEKSTFESLVGHEEPPRKYIEKYKTILQPGSHKWCLTFACMGVGGLLTCSSSLGWRDSTKIIKPLNCYYNPSHSPNLNIS